MTSCEKELISMYKINNLVRYINSTVHKPSKVQEKLKYIKIKKEKDTKKEKKKD